jgi:tetratricopeptide (TPR) repeat protein
MNTKPSSPNDWIRLCEDYLHTGELRNLEYQLSRCSSPECMQMEEYYRGRLAWARGDYENAARIFHHASESARKRGDSDNQYESSIWRASCYSFLGEYKLAQKIIEDVAKTMDADHRLYAHVHFVRGLIASEQGNLFEAKEAFDESIELSLKHEDIRLEARCCANLAVVCKSLGSLDRAGRLIQRVKLLNTRNLESPKQMMQVRNTEVRRLRLKGDLEAALEEGLPLPEEVDDGSLHYCGWLALNIAMVASDLDDFTLAEQSWERAAMLLESVQDRAFSKAELLWERAWIRYRQNRLTEAQEDIRRALNLIEAQMDTEHLHAYVISAIIDLKLGDLAFVSKNLRDARRDFDKSNKRMELASLQLHEAHYHLKKGHRNEAHDELIKALLFLREHRLFGSYYWDPDAMVPLCMIAISEDWGDQGVQLTSNLQQEDLYEVQRQDRADYYNKDVLEALGEYATTLVARRLAKTRWKDFVPLLDDSRAIVRLRAAKILQASSDPTALHHLEILNMDQDPQIRAWYQSLSMHGPAITVYSFGNFEILIRGVPLRLRNASTPKAKLVLGILLLCRDAGIKNRDLDLLLWPNLSSRSQRNSLIVTISSLNKALKEALGSEAPIELNYETKRYSIDLKGKEIWWDWNELCKLSKGLQIIEGMSPLQQDIWKIDPELFMRDFLEMLPKPGDLEANILWEWTSAYENIVEITTELEGIAHDRKEALNKRL